jgi:hypothetical protein
MKKSTHLILFCAFLFAAVFGLKTIVNTTALAEILAHANGQGALPAPLENGDTRKRIFSLSARYNDDGTVSGIANLHNPSFTGNNDQKYQLQIDISCMKVIGNTAFFGGLTRKTNDPNLVDAVYFSVQDNGEPGKDNDMISRAFFYDDDPTTTGDPQLCQNNNIGDFPMETIISGNINLRGATATP